MLDYRGIEALYSVLEAQSFEAAAKKLHITQSAVSQRIKALESSYKEPLLVRTLPYRLTPLGNELIAHFKRLLLLEEELARQISHAGQKPRLSIAINRDSLETWFLEIIKGHEFEEVMLEIIADDQELTLNYLKNGFVSACLSTSEKEILGGKVDFVGHMHYVLAASPAFAKKHFLTQDPQNLLLAPALKFDKHDALHERYLEKFFNLNAKEIRYYLIPSVRGFKTCALLGYGYALLPKIDIVKELQKKELVELYPDKAWPIPLYWHYWAVTSPFYQAVNAVIIKSTKRLFSKFT